MATLLPCPFCGGEADFEQVGGGPMREGFAWSVGCSDDRCLGFQSVTTYARKIEAATAWNTRTPSGLSLPESDSADHLGVVIGRKDTTR